MANLRWIKNDLFSIARRIKEIDRNYRIAFNTLTDKFEVHNVRQPDTLCLVLPYDRLDARTIQLVRKTRVSRADELIEEMERSNQQLEKDQEYAIKQKVMAQVEEVLCK